MLVPEVSVIMPAYNAAAFIQQSIESVIAQTFTNWELLIVDDGSTDDTKAIICKFYNVDERIKYFYQPNGKQGKARNLALKNAQGKYVAFLDADDIWLPEKLSIQLKEIKDKNVDLLFANGFTFTDAYPDYKNFRWQGIGYLSGENGVYNLLEKNKIATLTVFAKTEVINAVKGFTENKEIPVAEDYHLWLKLLMSGFTFYGSEKIIAGYRIQSGSATYSDKITVPRIIEVLEDLKKHYKPYKKIITWYQKSYFVHHHYLFNNWTEKQYRNLIRKNCLYVSNVLHNLFFQTTYSLFGFAFTRRLLNKIVNNNGLLK